MSEAENNRKEVIELANKIIRMLESDRLLDSGVHPSRAAHLVGNAAMAACARLCCVTGADEDAAINDFRAWLRDAFQQYMTS
jgi:hypothetical protein